LTFQTCFIATFEFLVLRHIIKTLVKFSSSNLEMREFNYFNNILLSIMKHV